VAIAFAEDWSDSAAWNRFVEGHDQARFSHLFAYGDVVACYGYKPVRLAFTRDGALIAVLPASIAGSIFFGRRLVSQPFSEYGGLLVDPELSPDDLHEIECFLREYLARRKSLHMIEMHGNHGIPLELRTTAFQLQNPHQVAVLSLDRSSEVLWKDVVRYSVRKAVNKAHAHDVEAFEECDPDVIRARFFPLYLESMKRLGVPPHSIAYYDRCSSLLSNRMKIFWARREGKILAGLLGFVCGKRVNIINIVSHAGAWKYAPNDLIHWEFIKWAAQSGLRHFDFGSVRYDGQETYKKKWGTEFEEHAYYFLYANGQNATRATLNSSSPQMAKLSKAWSAYVPPFVAKMAGPIIRKHLVR